MNNHRERQSGAASFYACNWIRTKIPPTTISGWSEEIYSYFFFVSIFQHKLERLNSLGLSVCIRSLGTGHVKGASRGWVGLGWEWNACRG